ncbi:TPA: hypothetical protein ACGR9J_000074 [Escherichia coli]
MNSLRPELLELTPQALTALSNAGFVKRSLKELENGNVPEISHENDALIATFCQRFACAVYCSSVADTLPGVTYSTAP